jgi:hypothetical protein
MSEAAQRTTTTPRPRLREMILIIASASGEAFFPFVTGQTTISRLAQLVEHGANNAAVNIILLVGNEVSAQLCCVSFCLFTLRPLLEREENDLPFETRRRQEVLFFCMVFKHFTYRHEDHNDESLKYLCHACGRRIELLAYSAFAFPLVQQHTEKLRIAGEKKKQIVGPKICLSFGGSEGAV